METATAVKKNGSKAGVNKKTGGQFLIKPILIQKVTFSIRQRGNSPLVCHNWGKKAMEMMRMTAAERRKREKVARDPEAEASAGCYYMADGRIGLNAMCIKKSMVLAAHKDFGLARTAIMKAIFIYTPDVSGNLPMEYAEMVAREDCVRVGQGASDLRYRPEFRGWSVEVTFDIDSRVLNAQDLINLADNAGYGCGLCEWRPEKGGEWGRYEVDITKPVVVV